MTTKRTELAKSKESRTEHWLKLYQDLFPAVAGFISRRGGDLEEAKDIFQEALIHYFEQFGLPDEGDIKKPQAYIMGTVKNMWYKKYRNTTNLSGDSDSINNNSEEDLYEEVNEKRLLHFLQKAGQKCLALLSAFYYHQRPLEEIATDFGFSGKRSATVQKHKCLSKVKQSIHEKSLSYADFME